ncbi:MAG: glycosyltransferase [Chloroflexi bacterium]|nr:glycosyltransferase [Chloroflexota bacterium]
MIWIFYWVYLIAASMLAIFGFNILVTAWLYWRKRDQRISAPELIAMPRVTVQLPIFNELYVVERLIDATAALDWRRDRLQIQVLDDSDDETTHIAQTRVDYHRQRGVDIELIRRADRAGFKAGALAEGMKTATGEFIAIFDADFVPPRAFLKQTIPHLGARAKVGLVQTRWGHLNAEYSALTRAQAIALDGHFVVEQSARARNGLFFNFNGTAGVWRRACIEQSGGWHGDTLSEDLDLSYRAQMRGWTFLFLPDVIAPAELPPQIHAYKRQQFRWAKGSTQCLLKLGPQIVTTRGLPVFKRIEGLLHLSGYVMNPLLVIMLLTLVPLVALQIQFAPVLMVFSLAMLGPLTIYALSQRALYRDWRARMRYFFVLVLLGTGLALNNSLAVLAAITRRGNTFRRTPKFRVETDRDAWSEKRYTLPIGWETFGELGLAAYALIGAAIAWHHHAWWTLPFLLLYAASFGFTGALSVWHARGFQISREAFSLPKILNLNASREI